jgi:ACS family tartrate transporter-like MFS transporter
MTGRGRMDHEKKIFAKVAWRLIPFMGLLYFVSFLDRVNVGFAALTMNSAIGLSAEAFGFGAGIFFIGYFLFEVPSNIYLERFGARVWIFRIMLTWGIISCAIPLASILGSPLSGLILGMDGFGGLAGWQWLFVLEGAPAVLLSFVVLAYLPNGPASACWLNKDEKQVITDALAREASADHTSLGRALADGRVWLLALIYFGVVVGLYGIGLWLPQIVKAMGFSNLQTGFVVAAPYVAAILVMVGWGHASDKRGERIWHVALPAFLGAAGFVIAGLMDADIVSLMALTLAAIGIYAALAPFWSLPGAFLGGTAAAGGIAFINSVGNLGGFLGPVMVGVLKGTGGGYGAGMTALGIALAVAGLAVLALGQLRGKAS